MSAEVDAAIDSWRVTLPCTRAEAEAIDAADDLTIDAVLMTTEEVEDDRERWRLDAYCEHRPDDAMIAALRALVPSAAGVEPVVEPLTAQDWVTMSQAGLEPIREGRFAVHTSAHPIDAPPPSPPIRRSPHWPPAMRRRPRPWRSASSAASPVLSPAHQMPPGNSRWAT